MQKRLQDKRLQDKDYRKIYIDKTEALEKGIEVFPSLFIEGAAACGKSTAMNMLLEAHPEIDSDVFFMEKEVQDFVKFRLRLNDCREHMKRNSEQSNWIVFENMNSYVTKEFYTEMVALINELPENARVFFISREKPAFELLELLWKEKMGIIVPKSFLFSKTEIETLVSGRKSVLDTEEIYQETGGWPGCVSLLLYLSEQMGMQEELCQCYEVQTYIQKAILNTLSVKEQKILHFASVCPWINEELCEEIFGIQNASTTLVDLERKGLLNYKKKAQCWKIANLFREKKVDSLAPQLAKELANWYQTQGKMEEALWCLKKAKCQKEYQECMLLHFDKIPLEILMQSDILNWKGNTPQLCYLRGMYSYHVQDFAGLHKELSKVQKLEGELAKEVYLNLAFAEPKITLDNWLVLLKELGKEQTPIRLYYFSEQSCECLNGLRELSGLFACTLKEENQNMRMLKKMLGEKEWLGIQLARIDYYLETERIDVVRSNDWELLLQLTKENCEQGWQYQMACFCLLNKMQRIQPESEILEQISGLQKILQEEESELCQKQLHAICSLYELGETGHNELAKWLKDGAITNVLEVNEENYFILFLQTKGYLLLNQHEKAERILKKLIPYLQTYHRSRLLAETTFQYAIINWANGTRGAALRNVIESFLYTGESRYVAFYSTYGKLGKEVLEEYVKWMSSNEPERWNKKKKYNYGNVLRMPQEEYLEVVLRKAKHGVKSYHGVLEQGMVERLTMMETIILQDINKGLTNAEICEELNLKLPTVKSHIYSVYKKLGVNSRVQAILKGKELGIVK